MRSTLKLGPNAFYLCSNCSVFMFHPPKVGVSTQVRPIVFTSVLTVFEEPFMALVKYDWIFKISIIRDLMKVNMDVIFIMISKGANISVF